MPRGRYVRGEEIQRVNEQYRASEDQIADLKAHIAVLVPIVRAAIAYQAGSPFPDMCSCEVCEAVRALPQELRDRLMKEAGE